MKTGLVILAALAAAGAAFYFLDWQPRHERMEKRFEKIDERIEDTLPKDRGLAPTPTFPEDVLMVRLKATHANGQTTVRIDTHAKSYVIPEDHNTIRDVVLRKMKARGSRPEEVRGEIKAPASVPASDVYALASIFFALGVQDVVMPSDGRTAEERMRDAAR